MKRRKRNKKRNSRKSRRKLSFESLEARQMLAVAPWTIDLGGSGSGQGGVDLFSDGVGGTLQGNLQAGGDGSGGTVMTSNVPGQNNMRPLAVDDTPDTGNAPLVNSNDGPTDITAVLLSNDSDPDAGGTVAIAGVSNLDGLKGKVTWDSATGQVLYDPNGQFTSLPEGTTGTDTFSYTIADQEGATDTATVTVQVTGTNDSPVIAGAAKVIVNLGDAAVNAGIFGDPDAGDSVKLAASLGTVTDNGNGTWNWTLDTPNEADQSQQITITATDSHGVQTTMDFELIVNYFTPDIAVANEVVEVDEGQVATNNGTFPQPDSSGLTLSASGGSVVPNADGTWNWSATTSDGPAQSQSITITAKDGNGNATWTTFDLVVNNVAPSVSVDNAVVEVDEGQTATNSGLFFDPGADSLTPTASAGSLSATADGTWTWSANTSNGPAQSQTVTITFEDSDGAATSTSFDLIVNNVAPSVSVDNAVVEVDEGQTATNSGTFSDPGADGLTISASFGNLSATADGTWSWSAPAADGPAQSQTVTITFTDSDGATGSTSFDLVVNNVAPSVSADNAVVEVDEGQTATNSGMFFDPGADSLIPSVSAGNLSATPDGKWTWSAETSNGPAQSQTITVTFEDSDGATTSTSFDLIVNNVAPSVSVDNAAVEVDEGQIATNSGTFFDPGTDGLTMSASFGNFSAAADGTWSWAAPAADGPNQSQTVTVTFEDSDGATGSTSFDLVVNDVAPSGAADNAVVEVDEGQTATNSGTLSDPGTDELTISASFGNALANGDGTWSWSGDTTDGPAQSQTVTVTFEDSDGATSSTSFDLIVNNVAPSVSVDNAVVEVDEGQTVANSGTFSDPGADNLTPSVSAGNISAAEDGTWSWSANTSDGPAQSQTITVTFEDSDGATTSTSFDLVVNNVAPSVSVDNAVVEVVEGETATNSGTFSDPGADGLSLTASIGTLSGGDGAWSWSLDTSNGPAESQTVTITAEDSDGGLSSTTFDLVVDNGGPKIAGNQATVEVVEGETATSSGTFTESDAGNLTLSASIGTLTNDGNGTWSWSFDTSDGPDQSQTVTITAEDGAGKSNSTTFELLISNAAPSVGSDNATVEVDEGQTATNTGTFSDPGIDAVTLSASAGTVTDTGNGAWSWSFGTSDGPDETQTITITAEDSDGDSATTTFDLVVNNLAPSTTADNATVEVDEGQTATNTGTFFDPGIDDVTLSASAGSVIDTGNGTWSWSFGTSDGPSETQTITITAEDSDGDSATTTFDLVVNNLAASVAADNATVEVNEGQTATNTGVFSDPGTDIVTLSASLGEVSDAGNGTWNWSFDTSDGPAENQTVSITAEDADGASTTTTFDLIVNNVAPSVTTDNATVRVGIGQTATNSGTFSDPGTDNVTLSASAGQVIDSGNGAWSWSLDTGAVAAESQTITITAADDDGSESSMSFELRVVHPVIKLVSISDSGALGNSDSWDTSVSADGRYVSFVSTASNLVPDDTNDTSDVFVYDRETATVTRVSVDSSGSEGNDQAAQPSISADGRYVAFVSAATNLVDSETTGVQVFLHDRDTGTTMLVSQDGSGNEGNGDSWSPQFSSDGNYIVFYGSADNLVGGDTNSQADVFVYEIATGAITRVNVDSDGNEANGNSTNPSISGDGRYVAFSSAATNLVADDTNDSYDVFVHDRETGTTTRVSVDESGNQGDSHSLEPSISADGRYVGFASAAANLVAGDTNGTYDIFVHDTQTGTTTRISLDSNGIESDGDSAGLSISSDGRFAAFTSTATNLVPDDTNDAQDIFLHDLQTGETTRLSISNDGIQGNQHSHYASVSADGGTIAFASSATNLLPGEANNAWNVFVTSQLVADAGGPYSIAKGNSVTLDGSGTIAAEAPSDSLTYQWDLNYDGSSFDVDLTGKQVATATFNDQMPARTIALRVVSSDGVSDIGTTTLEVTNTNPDLTVGEASVSVDEGQTATNSGTFADADGDAVTLSASVGEVVSGNDGTWDWSFQTTNGPEESQTVTITAEDADGGTTTTTFDLVVNSLVLIVAADNDSVTVDEGQTATNTGTFSAPDNATVGLEASFGTVTANADRTWSWEASTVDGPDDSQQVTITARESDGTEATVSFQLNVQNTAPVIDVDDVAVDFREGDTPTSAGTFSDAGDDDLTFEASVGTVTMNANGTWNWTLDATAATDDAQTVTITVTDSDGSQATTTFELRLVSTVIDSVSHTNSGTIGNDNSWDPSLSGDGRYVAFSSTASNLVLGDTNDSADIFVYDRQTATVSRVSVDDSGNEANSGSTNSTISDDGRYVAFVSDATNLVPGSSGSLQVYLHDRDTGTNVRVSENSSGSEGNDSSWNPQISGDGSFLTFHSDADNLVDGDTNDQSDVFVYEIASGTLTRVSVDSDGNQADGASNGASISEDGRYVTFSSAATNLVSDDTNGAYDVFVHDRETGTTTLVSLDDLGNQGNGHSYDSSISADGRYVAFVSEADNLVTDDTNGSSDILVRDLQNGTTTRVSLNSDGNEADGASSRVQISGDGRFVAFASAAANLVPDDTNGFQDIFVHDRQTGETVRVSVANDGSQGDQHSHYTAISSDGTTVAFASPSSNFIPGDSGSIWDVFVTSQIVAEAGGPYSVAKGNSVTLDGTSSIAAVVQQATLTFEWDLDYDGITFDTDLTGAQVTTETFDNQFIGRTVALRVTNADGDSDIATTTLEVTNTDPELTLDNDTVSVTEGQTATNSGAFADADGDSVTLAASVGTVTKNLDNTWTWSFDTSNGPAASQTVTITAEDTDGGSTSTTFELLVNAAALKIAEDSTSLGQDGGQELAAAGLTNEQLAPLVAAALERLTGASLTADQIAILQNTNVQIADLSEGVLGIAAANTIFIDVDASGHGWFVDTTPQDDLEFNNAVSPTELQATTGDAVGRVDLLTVLMHEMGHVLGIGHDHEDAQSLMAAYLTEGTRRVPEQYEFEGLDSELLDLLARDQANLP